MENQPTVTASGRLDFAAKPSERANPEEFLESFDIASVPTEPGCYIMYSEDDIPIYVGKANNLRARIRTYITERDSRHTVKFLMRRVAHMQFLVTTTEKEALLLENSLIKQHKPQYNIRLKDDKTYVSIRIDLREEFPRFTVVRRYKKDGARYFGPYSSAQSVRETMRQLHRLFPLRRCSDTVMRTRKRPCLYYQMGQCPGFCVGIVDRDAYHETLEQAIMVLEGRSNELERQLRERIERHVDALEFEAAAVLRDRLFALQRTVERQRTVAVPGAEDRDIFGYYTEGRYAEIQLLYFRGGKMLGGRSWSFAQFEVPMEELFGSFLLQFYAQNAVIPAEIIIPLDLEDAATLAEILSEERGLKVAVMRPQRGDKVALVEMAMRNAQSSFQEKRMADKAQADLLEQLRQTLLLQAVPHRMECYDISNIQGDKPVGSMVTFDDAKPNKARYRRFAIRAVEGQDDFAMLREVLLRRFRKGPEDKDLPDLIVIDGGKGQLNVALAALKDLGIDIPAVSIAKSRPGEEGPSPERFFIPGRMNPIVPPQHSAVVHLMARLRDEAHRFAITYHRARRAKSTLRTSLTEIPGIGPARARALLNKFGSLAKIRECSADEIAGTPGFNQTLAQAVYDRLRGNTDDAKGEDS